MKDGSIRVSVTLQENSNFSELSLAQIANMEAGQNLKDLDMTADEVDRLRKALRDDKFREMLRDYAEEISDPENKRRYEEEIELLERERGNSIDFIHPEPFRALKTSADGSRKCFINICSNEKVGKPECKSGVSEDGRRGQSWSMPHSLHPGRKDTDTQGNQVTIYDVIFHPDTLHIASKNKRFMDMVDSTAIQGIEKAFQVTLDKKNMRQLKTKYKGTPQPCVIRKPIPGYKDEAPPVQPDPLAFPFPGDKGPAPSSQTKPSESPASRNSSDAEPESFQVQPQQSKEPTQPNYTVKYRHFVDLQDFRNSRDSAQSPRPKEIVVTIDLPLLKSVSDTSLEVMKQTLVLDSEKPAYRLELPLAYPVDEDKGEAKFNKHRGQLTVTLPVLPSNEVFDYASWPAATVGDGQGEGVDERNVKESEEERGKEQERGIEKGEEEQICVEEDDEEVKQERVYEEDKKQQTTGGGEDEDREEQMRGDQGGVKGEERSEVGEEEEWRPHKKEGEETEDGVEREAKCKKQNEKEESVEKERGEEENAEEQKQENVNEEKLTAEHSREEEEVNLTEIQEKTEKMEENLQNVQVEAVEFHSHTSGEELSGHDVVEDVSQGTEVSETETANEPGRGGSGEQSKRDNLDEDDLHTEQIFQTPVHNEEPALLREIDEDGKENVLSDHSTPAGFILHNALMYELD
ncbi:protein kintoun [Pleuronectes platessa]|uniref:protein kintoun n=1 Tax=Pleuronectes platessa TaxID=8262 RepID=UPI00232A094F|nr:protein kintoun [Pleuronectes platessa]